MANLINKFLDFLFTPGRKPGDDLNRRQEPALRPQAAAAGDHSARAQLIEQAKAIQKSKQHLMDQLDPNVREKLTSEAFAKLGTIGKMPGGDGKTPARG